MAVSHESKSYHTWDYQHSDGDNISTPIDNKRYVVPFSYTDGSGDNQMQDMIRVEATVSIGEGNEVTYDLAGGVTDAFGNTITFATIKKIMIYNKATSSGEDLRIGGPTTGTTGALITDLFGDITGGINLRAGGVFSLETPLTGWTVTGGSADVLVISNEGTADITYELLIGGTR